MEFSDRVKALATRIQELREHASVTEEATKNALILPFLQALGYDTFDPRIVVPEYTADVGTKKGEKVDYAIKREERSSSSSKPSAPGPALIPARPTSSTATSTTRLPHASPS